MILHQQRATELGGLIPAKKQEANAASDPKKAKELLTEVAYLEAEQKSLPELLNLASNIPTKLDKVKKAIDDRKIQEGWGLYYEAELLYYRQLSPDASRAEASNILNKRIEILGEGDKKTVKSLLGVTDDKGNWSVKPRGKLNVEDVVKAKEVVQKHYENKYIHLEMVQKQLIILGIVAIPIFILLIGCMLQVPDNNYTLTTFSANNFTATNVNATYTNSTAPTLLANFTATNFTANNVTAVKTSVDISSGDLSFWCSVALFGALGGTVSGIITIKDAFKTKEDIPERVLNGWVTFARPLVGLLVSIAITVFLLSGIFTLLETAVTKYVIFAVAFASGFTERLIVGVVKKAEPKSEED